MSRHDAGRDRAMASLVERGLVTETGERALPGGRVTKAYSLVDDAVRRAIDRTRRAHEFDRDPDGEVRPGRKRRRRPPS